MPFSFNWSRESRFNRLMPTWNFFCCVELCFSAAEKEHTSNRGTVHEVRQQSGASTHRTSFVLTASVENHSTSVQRTLTTMCKCCDSLKSLLWDSCLRRCCCCLNRNSPEEKEEKKKKKDKKKKRNKAEDSADQLQMSVTGLEAGTGDPPSDAARV